MEDLVTPDGSPIAVYLALEAGDAPALIHAAVPAGASILELGSGPGRLTRPLLALGHPVLAVDDAPEALAFLPAEHALVADVLELDLARRFDVVLAASHLINMPERAERSVLLDVCRRHIDLGGYAILERFPPEWARHPAAGTRDLGLVQASFELLAHDPPRFEGAMTYRIGARSWTQRFAATHLEDDDLAEEADRSGLTLVRWLDDARSWALLAAV